MVDNGRASLSPNNGNNKSTSTDSEAANERQQPADLTVCDIIGDWGLYQWSVTLFATLYSALAGIMVVVGPIWTPEMGHYCAVSEQLNGSTLIQSGKYSSEMAKWAHECLVGQSNYVASLRVNNSQAYEAFEGAQLNDCPNFIYDEENYGKLLTNTFDLVCSRQWLRSFISSSSLTGMLLSSVTLGLVGDKYGRMCSIQTGFVISISATLGAILAGNYLILNICFMLMSYGQVGVANALCTLVMEATSPRWRFVPIFEYGFGWGLGMLVTPLLNNITKDYQIFLLILLIFQLLMIVWLRLGVFESIRWLLSEGHINRAQIELQRACRINRISNGAELAQKIAQVQVQQVRKASSVIEEKMAPLVLSPADQQHVANAAQELSMLGEALRSSFAISSECLTPKGSAAAAAAAAAAAGDANSTPSVDPSHADLETQTKGAEKAQQTCETEIPLEPPVQALSPTLARQSFSLSSPLGLGPKSEPEVSSEAVAPPNSGQVGHSKRSLEIMIFGGLEPRARQSITTQCLIQLALKYSKTLQKQDEGTFFVVRMFHRKLYKATVLLMLLSVVLETTYYGLVQANGIVGSDMSLNYISGGITEWVAATGYMLVLWIFSRRLAIILPTILSSLTCLGIALAYHLVPGAAPPQQENNLDDSVADIYSQTNYNPVNWHMVNITGSKDQIESFIQSDNLSGYHESFGELLLSQDPVALRETINFWLMNFGKLSVTVAIQVAATVSMETYPNNLRQTCSGAIVFVGRIGSIMAPFLFNDHSPERNIFKVTLLVISVVGFLVCLLVPFFLRDTKNKELCDQLNDIEET